MNDENYIKLCIELAKRGRGFVSPNPLVGCLIVKDDKIISAGFHQRYGDNHAEINAINSSKEPLIGSTLYVNLEPCVHFGKTPPCVEKIVSSGINKVVVGTIDRNPLINGKGIEYLKQAGIEVKVGVLEKECIELNQFFFKYITKKEPFVTLKIAQTLDGFIADQYGRSKWITSLASRKIVHHLRSQYDAVLIGVNTANIDNPNLDVRLTEGRNPFRVILDTNLKIKNNLKLINKNFDSKTILFCSDKAFKSKSRKLKYLNSKNVEVIKSDVIDNKINLKKILKKLARMNISSILVEGGSKIFSSFFEKNLWDEINLFIAPKIFGKGIPSFSNLNSKNLNAIDGINLIEIKTFEKDIFLRLTKNNY